MSHLLSFALLAGVAHVPGMLSWTAYEVCFVHLFAKGGPTAGVAYTPDDKLFATLSDFAPTFFWTLA
eukprot:SAG31_NODE_4987_length_2819_cov_1.180147_1_plen_66_part_10